MNGDLHLQKGIMWMTGRSVLYVYSVGASYPSLRDGDGMQKAKCLHTRNSDFSLRQISGEQAGEFEFELS